MNRLELAEYRSRAAGHADAVARTPGICGFCSAPLWQLAAHDHLHRPGGERETLLVERDGAWLVAADDPSAGLHFPLEAAWMFGCPLAGDPAAAVDLLAEVSRRPELSRDRDFALAVGGLARGGAMHRALLDASPRARALGEFPSTDVMLIDLADGPEAWLARRSKKFRRSLREVEVEIPGLEILDASRDDPEDSFVRLLEIQRATYKWAEGGDIFQVPGYEGFYRSLLEGLHARGGLRLLFARRDGLDLAHIFGGVLGGTYRGLQMSFREEARPLALGNRLQWENLRRRAAEGIELYDLGMPSPYKERWADRREERLGVLWVGGV